MANKLKEMFHASKQELEQIEKLIEEWNHEAIKEKRCCVCKHYSYDPTVPGYIHYEGDCAKGYAACFCKRGGTIFKKCKDFELDQKFLN